jgi:hypothetical protein
MVRSVEMENTLVQPKYIANHRWPMINVDQIPWIIFTCRWKSSMVDGPMVGSRLIQWSVLNQEREVVDDWHTNGWMLDDSVRCLVHPREVFDHRWRKSGWWCHHPCGMPHQYPHVIPRQQFPHQPRFDRWSMVGHQQNLRGVIYSINITDD